MMRDVSSAAAGRVVQAPQPTGSVRGRRECRRSSCVCVGLWEGSPRVFNSELLL